MANIRVIDIPIAPRQGALVSPEFSVPQNMSGELQLIGNIPTADYENTANSISAALYQEDASVPGGWRFRAGSTWRGKQHIEEGVTNPPPIFLSLSVSSVERGQNFRAEVDIPVLMNVGFSVERMER